MAIREHENHIELEDNAILWRYISFEKYCSLLETSALFFCRADKFSDPFEGSILTREADYRISEEKHLAQQQNRDYDEQQARKNSEDMAGLHRKIISAVTVNCWHINKNESDAMWQLYLKNNEGVAIQSSKEKLIKSLEQTHQKIGLSKVRYLDYDKDIWFHKTEYPHRYYNLVTPLIHKRVQFSHENEFRLYNWETSRENDSGYWLKQKFEAGELIHVDINSLIEKIILCPSSDSVFENKIKQFTKTMGYNFSFEKSNLINTPRY